MSKSTENENRKIILEVDPDKADAISMQLGEVNKTLEGELGSAFDALYTRNVPPKLKQFLEYQKGLRKIAEAKA